MKNINKILLIVVIILLLIVVGFLVYQFQFREKPFYAVYLRTGDLYFGKLVRFPSFGLKQAYLFQVNPQNQENPLSVQRFSRIFWGPEDFMKINKENVVWIAKLSKESQLYQLIKNNPDLIPQGNVNNNLNQNLQNQGGQSNVTSTPSQNQ